MTTLRTDAHRTKYTGFPRDDGEVEIYTNQRPEWHTIRAFDGTTTSIAAGQSVTYDVTAQLVGTKSVSVTLVEMNRTCRVTIETSPVAGAGWYTEASVNSGALTGNASARCGFEFDGPLGAHVQLVITNTSAQAGTLKGVFVAGR